MERRSASDRIYLVNELGYQIFLASERKERLSLGEINARLSKERTEDADWVKAQNIVFSDDEIIDAQEIAARTRDGIPYGVRYPRLHIIPDTPRKPLPSRQSEEAIMFVPYFKGAGILGPCNGDCQYGNTLVEVKAGERDLRSIDFRQVLIYYVISYLENFTPRIENVLILNPRQGYRVGLSFADLMSAISGLSAVEFTAIFRDYLVNWKACD